MPSGHNRDKLFRQIIADKAGELCGDKIELQVDRIETHGSINPTRFVGNWLTISQRAILKCEKLKHEQKYVLYLHLMPFESSTQCTLTDPKHLRSGSLIVGCAAHRFIH
jgi:hypothetical protein